MVPLKTMTTVADETAVFGTTGVIYFDDDRGIGRIGITINETISHTDAEDLSQIFAQLAGILKSQLESA